MKFKKFFSIILAFTLVFSLATFAAPAAFADGVGFAVTKHPSSETVSAGSKVLFVSYPNAAQYEQYWVFEDGAGQRIDAENLPNYYPGVKVEFDGTKVRVLNVAEEMSGLAVQAIFVREGVEIRSNYATLTVTPGQRCAETPCTPCTPCEKVTTACTIRITKQPVSEEALSCTRSSTWFSVEAENAASFEWYCRIGRDGTPMTVEYAVEKYGVHATGYHTNKLDLEAFNSNGWEGIDGWWWMCKIYDCNGCCAQSDWVITQTAKGCTAPPPCPYTPVPPCQNIVVVPPCQPIPPCVNPCYGYGWSVTEYESTTSTHTETDSTSHTYGVYFG